MDFSNPLTLSVELEKGVKGVNGDGCAELPDLGKGNEKPKKFRKMYLAALVSLFHAMCMGFASTYTATALHDMKQDPKSPVKPNPDEEGWIGSILALGALLGGLIAGNLAQSAGRKGGQIISTLPFIIGWLLITFATSVPYLYAGRIFAGLSCGLVSVTSPMYLVEISTPEVRGLLGASFQLFVMVGVLLVNIFGSVMHWNWVSVMGCSFSVVLFIITFFIPESPRWLMAKGKKDKAMKAIDWLQNGFVDSLEMCIAIQKDIDNRPQGTISLREFLAPDAYKPALLSFALVSFQQVCGINAILFYTVDIFNNAGSSIKGTYATIIVVALGLISTFISSLLLDKVGRRILLLASGACMALSLLIFGIFEYVAEKNDSHIRANYGWIPIFCLIIFVAAFSIGYGPIPYLMVGELTTARLRSITSGFAAGLNRSCLFAVTKSFHIMTLKLHTYGVYWFFSSVCFLSCLFTLFLLPETKGKTFEEIQAYFTKKNT